MRKCLKEVGEKSRGAGERGKCSELQEGYCDSRLRGPGNRLLMTGAKTSAKIVGKKKRASQLGGRHMKWKRSKGQGKENTDFVQNAICNVKTVENKDPKIEKFKEKVCQGGHQRLPTT